MHIFNIHSPNQEADGLHHNDGIRSLDGDDDIREVLVATDAEELHTGSDHALGGVAVAAHDAVGERTVVYADANGRPVLATDVEEGDKAVANLLKLGGVFLVRVFQMAEGFDPIDIVAGVDAHLFDVASRRVGSPGIEVDVSNQRRVITFFV